MREALETADWPPNAHISADLEKELSEAAIAQGLLLKWQGGYAVGAKAASIAAENRRAFEHARDRFVSSLTLRVKRDFPSIDGERAETLARDIEGSLTEYFREGGLTLASILFSRDDSDRSQAIPTSVLQFVNDACARGLPP